MQDESKVEVGETLPQANPNDPRGVALEAPPKTDVVAVEQNPVTPQETGTLLKRIGSPGALAEYPKSSAVRELYETGVRGGGMVLLFTMVHGIESELRETKAQLDSLRQLHQDECLKTARLEAQLASERKLKILQNVLLTGGGLLNTLAVKLLFDQQKPAGVMLLVLGFALLFTGWLWPKGGNSKR